MALKVLLDTNAYSAMRRGHAGVASILRRSDQVFFSAIVAGELLHGFRRGSRYDRNRDELDDFLTESRVILVEVTLDTANWFSRVATDLAAAGSPIPTNDIWIAAHAFEHGAEVITFDAHFSKVAGLAWTTPRD